MKLKFIGKDGSMGLNHGNVYDITIFTENGHIVVRLGPHRYCPYKSPQALAANWEATEDAVEVVRCADCVYCEKELDSYWCCKSWNRFDSTPPYNKVSEADYCSRGERRTNHGKG